MKAEHNIQKFSFINEPKDSVTSKLSCFSKEKKIYEDSMLVSDAETIHVLQKIDVAAVYWITLDFSHYHNMPIKRSPKFLIQRLINVHLCD